MALTRRVAKIVMLDSDDNFLLLTRSETHPKYAGYFDLPGGAIETGEEWSDGIIREVSEETGIIVPRENLNVMYTTTLLINEKSYPTLLYHAKIGDAQPQVVLSWEHQAFEWAPLDRLQEVEPQLAPTYREALDYIRRHNIIEDIELA